jgi:hypothetical protein
MVIWYTFPVLVGILYQEKSGNPDSNPTTYETGKSRICFRDVLPTFAFRPTFTNFRRRRKNNFPLKLSQTLPTYRLHYCTQGEDVMILKIFSTKNLAKILAFLLKPLLVFSKNLNHNIVF